MTISQLITVLKHIHAVHGDMPLQIQMHQDVTDQPTYRSSMDIHICPEEYNDGYVLNIRDFPY